MNVDILHFGDIIQVLRLIVEGLCQRGMGVFARRVLEDALAFCLIEHEGVADKAFLQSLSAADEVVFALHFRQLLRLSLIHISLSLL